MENTVEVADMSTLLAALQASRDDLQAISYQEMLDLLADSGVVVTVPETPRSGPPGARKVLVPGTRVYVKLAEVRALRMDLVTFLATYLLTTSLPTAGLITIVSKATKAFQLLDEDEAEFLRVIAALTNGHPYESWVDEAAITRVYAEATVDYNALADSVQRRRMLERDHLGRMRLVA